MSGRTDYARTADLKADVIFMTLCNIAFSNKISFHTSEL